MEFDAPTIAILIVFAGIIVGLIWDWSGDWKDTFDDFWEELDWKDKREEPDRKDKIDGTKRTKSGKK